MRDTEDEFKGAAFRDEKTKDYYLNYINNHIVPALGDTPLEKLTTIQIQKFYNDLQKSDRIQRHTHIKLKDMGLSTRVVRGIHTLLSNCLDQAVAERLIELMQERGMTQYQLYMKSGVPKSTIGNLVNCAYPSMKLRVIHELCQGMEIDLSSFFASPLFDENNLEP